ncbi:hypothetical protein H2198_008304 [Neophaeococcomyces mojaviensis]|uniref:Uncharacterized protein n=1 Tax=Neophaeococcomyces mojaviensis TaxID=3383035 RepID=A0ACC2ZXI1_9EURO|nr:hypothetical protein H2198_008304 [Knufia sp. JES_112]
MGFWNDGIRSRSPSPSQSRRRHSPARSSKGPYSRPSNARSTSSFIESLTGYSTASRNAAPRAPSRAGSTHSSSRGIFGSSSKHHSHGSRAQPRRGFVARVQKWLRDLYYYLKKHPVKVFFLVIMPLITGGALTKLLHTVGIRLPRSIERMVGSSMNRGYGDNQRFYARGGARDFDGGTSMPGIGGAGLGESAMGLFKMAKMFM